MDICPLPTYTKNHMAIMELKISLPKWKLTGKPSRKVETLEDRISKLEDRAAEFTQYVGEVFKPLVFHILHL